MDTVKIDARDVNFWYGDFHALKGISMPSRILSGIAFNASSVVRITKGTQSKPNVKEPARILSPKGIWPAIVGTFYLMVGSALFAFPVGVMSGIYMNAELHARSFATLLLPMPGYLHAYYPE